MLRSVGCRKRHAGRCFCIRAIVSLSLISENCLADIRGRVGPKGEEIFNHPISEMLANVCLGLDERKKTKRFYDSGGHRLVQLQKCLRRKNFEWRNFLT